VGLPTFYRTGDILYFFLFRYDLFNKRGWEDFPPSTQKTNNAPPNLKLVPKIIKTTKISTRSEVNR